MATQSLNCTDILFLFLINKFLQNDCLILYLSDNCFFSAIVFKGVLVKYVPGFYLIALAVCSCTLKISKAAESTSKPLQVTAEQTATQKDCKPEFIRDFLSADGKYTILIKKNNSFEFLPRVYDGVFDPHICHEDCRKFDSEFSSRAFGFERYPAMRYDDSFIAVKSGSAWGFIDIANGGTEIISPQYDEVHPFKEELAAVKTNGLWGFIDRNNVMLIPPSYKDVHDFFNGICIVVTSTDGGDRFAAIDKTGHIIFSEGTEKKFSIIYDFYEPHLARAAGINYETYGINTKGEIILSNIQNIGDRGGPEDPFFNFDDDSNLCTMEYFTKDASKEFSADSQKRYYGAFDREGTWRIKPQRVSYKDVYAQYYKFSSSGILSESRDARTGKEGFKDNKGSWVIPPHFDYVNQFNGNYATVRFGQKTGIIDKTGEWTVEPAYDSIRDTDCPDYFRACIGNKYGIIKGDGTIIIKFLFDRLGNYDGVYPLLASSGETKGFVNSASEWIITGSKKDSFGKFKDGIAFKFTEQKPSSNESLHHRYLVKSFLPDGTELFTNKKLFEEYDEPDI